MRDSIVAGRINGSEVYVNVSYIENDDPGDVDVFETMPCPRGGFAYQGHLFLGFTPRKGHVNAIPRKPCCLYTSLFRRFVPMEVRR